jgi:acetylornithine deacetylase
MEVHSREPVGSIDLEDATSLGKRSRCGETTVRSMVEGDVERWIGSNAERLHEFLRDLLTCPAPSWPPSDGANAQERLADELTALGFETELLTPDVDGLDRKYESFGLGNAHAQVGPRRVVLTRVEGLGGGRSLLLNGHADVVGPGDVASWTRPPFAGTTDGGRLVGRGAADARGPLAALVYALACARDVSGGLAGDVMLVSVGDEEIGGPGTLAALDAGWTADAAIVGEPTGLAVCPASRVAASFRLEVSGVEAHAGAAFKGVNAILNTAKYIEALVELQAELDRTRPHPLYENVPVAHAFNIATISGGEHPGVVPKRCVLEVVAGGVPGETPRDLRSWVAACVDAVTQSDEWLAAHPPKLTWLLELEGASTPTQDPFVQAALAAGRRALRAEPLVEPFLGGSDLRFVTTEFEIPAVHIGPGDMLAAHGYNESVELREVARGAAFCAHVLLEWSGRPYCL